MTGEQWRDNVRRAQAADKAQQRRTRYKRSKQPLRVGMVRKAQTGAQRAATAQNATTAQRATDYASDLHRCNAREHAMNNDRE